MPASTERPGPHRPNGTQHTPPHAQATLGKWATHGTRGHVQEDVAEDEARLEQDQGLHPHQPRTQGGGDPATPRGPGGQVRHHDQGRTHHGGHLPQGDVLQTVLLLVPGSPGGQGRGGQGESLWAGRAKTGTSGWLKAATAHATKTPHTFRNTRVEVVHAMTPYRQGDGEQAGEPSRHNSQQQPVLGANKLLGRPPHHTLLLSAHEAP